MQAKRIKLDGALVQRLKRLKPRNQALSAFVRDVLAGEVRNRGHLAAADRYAEFLRAHPMEADAMDAWMAAPLTRSAQSTRRS